MSSQLQQSLTRFASLYPLLAKQHHKSSQAGQAATFTAHQAGTKTPLVSLNLQDRLQIIQVLAKGEVVSLAAEAKPSFLAEVMTHADQLCQKPVQTKTEFAEHEYFILIVFLQLAVATGQSQLNVDLLINMIVRAQQYIAEVTRYISTQEDAANLELSLSQDKQLKNHLDFIYFILFKHVIKRDFKNEVNQLLVSASASISKFLLQAQADQEYKLTAFAVECVWLKVLQQVLGEQARRKQQLSLAESKELKTLLDAVFSVLKLHRTNSKFYMTQVGAHQLQKADQDISTKKCTKRDSVLYSEILDLLINFLVQYLTMAGSGATELSQSVFTLLLADDSDELTLPEQLNVVKQLNRQFYRIPAIAESPKYWQLIRDGLQDIDQICRNVAIYILKETLMLFSEDKAQGKVKLHLADKDYEQLWATFFDVYDTLESFSSHLIKAIWHRVDVFFDFIKTNKDLIGLSDASGNFPKNQLHMLEDFRAWLNVLYGRVQSHSNLKTRKYVQKATLKRPFVTEQMRGYFFGEFLAFLNQGHLFRSHKTVYTQFSKNAQQIHDFFSQYFANESTHIGEDLRMLLVGMSRVASHHQMFLICLRLLATQFGKPGEFQFVGTNELVILDKVFSSNFTDLYFSNKYLCKKFTLQLIANYLVVSDSTELDWKLLFKLLGSMYQEFFSTRTVFVDQEALQATARLLEAIGCPRVQSAITDYLLSLFTVKALHLQMPKFGTHYQQILQGIGNLVLIAQLVYQDPVTLWFVQTMEQCLATFDQMLESTYLSNQLVESKVHCLELVLTQIYTYGQDSFRQRIRASSLTQRVGPVLSRVISNLVGPLTSSECLPSEQDKINAAFGNLRSYARFVGLAIRMFHLHEKTAHNALQSFIKALLTEGLKVTQTRATEPTWRNYLMQHAILAILQAVFSAYATGIQESIKSGVDHFFVPDELFQFGQPLLTNLISFKPQLKPLGPTGEMQQEHSNFLLEHETSLLKINQSVLIDSWKVIADIVHIFQFDPALKQELATIHNSQIAAKALDFLSASTEDYNQCLFKILKMSYLPTVIAGLQTLDKASARQTFESYQQTILRCWKIVKDLRTDLDAETLVEFVEMAFSPDLLESYQIHLSDVELYKSLVGFHTRLADEMIDHSNGYWLILRGFFNHLMFTFATKPHLMRSFEPFVINFAMARELRSLDSEIKLYKLQTMLPLIISKDYEDLPLQEITFQGAYVRTITLIIIEGIVHEHVRNLKEAIAAKVLMSQGMEQVTDCLETLMRDTLNMNFNSKKMKKVDCPFGEGHRLKLRNWCFLLCLLQLLDPKVYTEEFRRRRVAMGRGDIVADVLKGVWEVIKQNNLASIRQYIEVFMIKFILKFPDLALSDPSFFQILLDPKITRPQISSSMLTIVGTILISNLNTTSAVSFKKKIFENLLAFTVSNSAHSRCISQYYLLKLQSDPQFGSAFMPTAIQPILKYLNESKDAKRVIAKYEVQSLNFCKNFLAEDSVKVILCNHLDQEGEYISESFVESLRAITTEVISALRKEDLQQPERKDYWKMELDRRIAEENLELHVNEGESNYQRKILPWEQLEFDSTVQQREVQRRRNEIIIVATLVDKVPNLAGLARTSEIMNASALIVDKAEVAQSDEFKSISVTSEKWLPIYEVKEKDLLNYLHYQKSNGYVILGIEQTANSKMLHEYDFPSKCILLLGKEKEGIPQEYYGILDQCIEIPQFGVIRSLNVHVSGALCLWEYTKQMIQPKK